MESSKEWLENKMFTTLVVSRQMGFGNGRWQRDGLCRISRWRQPQCAEEPLIGISGEAGLGDTVIEFNRVIQTVDNDATVWTIGQVGFKLGAGVGVEETFYIFREQGQTRPAVVRLLWLIIMAHRKSLPAAGMTEASLLRSAK